MPLASQHEIALDLHLENGAHEGEGVDHRAEKGAISQASEVGTEGLRAVPARDLPGDFDAVEQFAGFVD